MLIRGVMLMFAMAFASLNGLYDDAKAKPAKAKSAPAQEQNEGLKCILSILADIKEILNSTGSDKDEKAKELVKGRFALKAMSKKVCKKEDEEVMDLITQVLARLYGTDSIMQTVSTCEIIEKSMKIKKKGKVKIVSFVMRDPNTKAEHKVEAVFLDGKLIEIKVDNIQTINPILQDILNKLKKDKSKGDSVKKARKILKQMTAND
jgi:hypothetical protein